MAGPEGPSSAVATAVEPADSNCPGSGTKLTAGRDTHRNGTLEDAEVEASLTRYVCNGPKGTTAASSSPAPCS